MRFIKEIIALIIIVICVVGSDIYVLNFTENSIAEIEKDFNKIIENALNEENYKKEYEIEKIEKFEEKWKEIENKLAYFTEHDELEKVSVTIAIMKADVEANLKEDAYEKMQEIKFRMEHIKTKQKLKLNNIF